MDAGAKEKPLFMRIPEYAREIKASKSKVYEGVKSGEIPSVRIAGMLRIPRAALEKLEHDAMKAAEHK